MTAASRTTSAPWPAVLLWVTVGVGAGIGVISLLTVGPFLLLAALVLSMAALATPRLRQGASSGLLLGAATAPLLLAWLNRAGPGTVCRVNETTTTCSERWSPWPFLLVAVALVVGGLLLARRELKPRGDRSAGPA